MGSILVTGTTDPDWVPIMRQARGIITDFGGRTSHAAIISRELGVPAVVGTGKTTETLTDGQEVTISCAEGEVGHVYEGALEYKETEIILDEVPDTETRIMMNISNPSAAFCWWRLPNQTRPCRMDLNCAPKGQSWYRRREGRYLPLLLSTLYRSPSSYRPNDRGGLRSGRTAHTVRR